MESQGSTPVPDPEGRSNNALLVSVIGLMFTAIVIGIAIITLVGK